MLKFCRVLVMLLLCNVAFAQDPAPVAMLQEVTSKMLSELDKNITTLKTNDQLVYYLVAKILVPHFDLATMSRNVVDKENWSQANAVTKEHFMNEFTKYVIRTYAAALKSYDGETIKFYPIRGDITGQTRLQVNSDLLHKDGPPIQIQYRLGQEAGKWLIYDFSVAGVSIVQNYHAQFANVLRQHGLEYLVQQLHKRNAGLH